jgi:hypothetical protein
MGLLRRWFTFGDSGGLDPLTTAYFNGMQNTVPADFKKLVDTYWTRNKKTVNGNVITTKQIVSNAAKGGDVIYLGNINNSNDSFRNFVKNAHHGTIEGSGLVFDPYWGWTNPAGTGYVDTHYNPSTEGDKYTLNNACVGVYSNANKITQALIGVQDGTSTTGISLSTTSGLHAGFINSNTVISINTIPFGYGLHTFGRTSSSVYKYNNQNIPIATGASSSIGIPNGNVYLFRRNGSATAYTTEGLSFTYIGSSLTDDEFTALNLIVNEYLIQCLYYKYDPLYASNPTNWSVIMADSYFNKLHNFEPYEAWEVYEVIKRCLPDYVDSAGTGYYYNTFGPSGQNKTVCDFLMLFKAGGNLLANIWTKTGATLRWNQYGTIASSNTMPAYTRGTNLGIVTVSSTDGWNGVTVLSVSQSGNSVNAFYGNVPIFTKLKTGGSNFTLAISGDRCKVDVRLFTESLINNLQVNTISYPGYNIINIDNFIGNQMTGFAISKEVALSDIIGNLSLITNELQSATISITAVQTSGSFRIDNAIGTLANMVLNDATTFLRITYSSITGGTSTWNKNIGTFTFNNNKFAQAATDNQLVVIDNYFVGAVIPIKNLTANLSGTPMAAPSATGVTAKNSIIAKHVAAGRVATITTN